MQNMTSRENADAGGAVGAKHGVWVGICRVVHASGVMVPFRKQAGRRRLVGLALVVLAAFPVLGWLVGQLWAVMLNMILFAVASVLLGVATQGMLDKPLSMLDERQVQLRRNLFREPYFTGVAFGLAGGVVIAVAMRLDEAPMVVGLILFVWGVVFGLPSMVLAWVLPEDDDDEE